MAPGKVGQRSKKWILEKNHKGVSGFGKANGRTVEMSTRVLTGCFYTVVAIDGTIVKN